MSFLLHRKTLTFRPSGSSWAALREDSQRFQFQAFGRVCDISSMGSVTSPRNRTCIENCWLSELSPTEEGVGSLHLDPTSGRVRRLQPERLTMCVCPFQLQRCSVARVVRPHPARVVYPVYGRCDAYLTPWMISKGRSSGLGFLLLNSLEQCLLRRFSGGSPALADCLAPVHSLSSEIKGTETPSLLHTVVLHDCCLDKAPPLRDVTKTVFTPASVEKFTQ